MSDVFTQIRCTNCNTLLLEADLRDGVVKKICPKCKTINTVRATSIPATQGFQERLVMNRK